MPGIAADREPEVIRRRLAGERVTQIAEAMGVSHPTIVETLAKPHVRAEIDAVNADALEAVKDRQVEAVTAAMEALIVLAKGDPDKNGKLRASDAVRRQAASDLLDRFGLKPETTVRTPDAPTAVLVVLRDLTVEQLGAAAWGAPVALEAPRPALDVAPVEAIDIAPEP